MLRSCLIILTILTAFTAGTAYPFEDWKDGTYFKRDIAGQSLSIQKLFLDFSKAQNIPVVIDEAIDGFVNAQYPPLSPTAYLDAVARDNGLVWYDSGGVIYISMASQLQSRVLPLNAVDLERLKDILKTFGVYTDKFPILSDAQLGIVYAVGPARYLDEIEKISSNIESAVRRQANISVDVEVFPLQYAWADDQVITIGENEVAIPGVATILRNVLDSNSGALGLQGRAKRQIPFNRPGLRGQGLINPYNQLLVNAQQAAVESQIAAAQAQARFQAAESIEAEISREGGSGAEADAIAELAAKVSVVIQSDPRLNAVIIRDVRERMEGYRKIIEELDQPVGLVQIKATLIDVDANHSFELGTPYNIMWNDGGDQNLFQARLDTGDINNLATNPGNLTVSLAENQVSEFLVNLKALEADGHARMISKPSILTLDNQEAYLEEAEEFFVRVQGQEQVDLFNVLVGTKLYIAPHIIQEGNVRRVKINVRIEDGNRSETATVDQIPVVSRNTINTQAVLLEGQSLLIGGLMREEESENIRAVPLLGRIPKVGALFRESVQRTRRVERMVMLTPTIVSLPPRRPLPSCEPHWNPLMQEGFEPTPLPTLPGNAQSTPTSLPTDEVVEPIVPHQPESALHSVGRVSMDIDADEPNEIIQTAVFEDSEMSHESESTLRLMTYETATPEKESTEEKQIKEEKASRFSIFRKLNPFSKD